MVRRASASYSIRDDAVAIRIVVDNFPALVHMKGDQQEKPLWIAASYAALLAAAANSLFYVICYASGIIPWNMLSPGRGVSITPRLVILVSIGGAIAGALIYSLIRRTSSDPVHQFRRIATVALILSFAAPLSIETFTTPLTIALDVMHLVVYISTVWALTIWSRPDQATASA
jgi:hypothetical protein